MIKKATPTKNYVSNGQPIAVLSGQGLRLTPKACENLGLEIGDKFYWGETEEGNVILYTGEDGKIAFSKKRVISVAAMVEVLLNQANEKDANGMKITFNVSDRKQDVDEKGVTTDYVELTFSHKSLGADEEAAEGAEEAAEEAGEKKGKRATVAQD
jgi:hypothetical protein